MLGEVTGCVGYDSVCECRLSVNGHPPVVEGSVNGYIQIIYHDFVSVSSVNFSLGCNNLKSSSIV